MRSKFKDEHSYGELCEGEQLPQIAVEIYEKYENVSTRSYTNFPLLSISTISEKRKAEAERIRQKYPDRIPVSDFSIQKHKTAC